MSKCSGNVRTVCGLAAATAIILACCACGKRVPSEVQPALDAIRADARNVAAAAAKACEAEFTSGRFVVSERRCSTKLLAGESVTPVVPSPAKGTSLESNPMVLDVWTMCSAPTKTVGNISESCGSSLGELRNAFNLPGAGRRRNVAEGNCKSAPTDCEDVIVPSQVAADENSTDLRIVKPVAGGPPGATAEVTIILGKK
jgi:hypothetical protein